MNTRSIRFRLTRLYGTVLISIAFILFLSFYWVTSRQLYRNTDIVLRSHAVTVRQLLSTEDIGSRQISSIVFHKEAQDIPGMVVVIVSDDGDLLYASPNVQEPRRVTGLVTPAQRNEEISVNSTLGSQAMRFILLHTAPTAPSGATVIVGHPIDVIQNSLKSLVGILGLVFLGLVIPGIWLGSVLAGSALGPIRKLSDEIEHIQDKNLGGSVPNPGTEDELEQLTHSFNRLLERLDKTFRRERQFLADVAHEVKTPIATMKTGIEVALSKKRTPEEYKTTLTHTAVDVERLSRTLTALLDLAWSQTDISRTRLTPISLSGMLGELLEITQRLASQKKITVEAAIAPDIVIMGKKDAIFRAILNVLENAVKYTPKGGSIHLSLEQRNGAYVTVRDTGAGIAKGDLPHIFDRFYRGSREDATEGSGLGLSIARAIVAAHGGDITVSSLKGRGTAFYLFLPITSG